VAYEIGGARDPYEIGGARDPYEIGGARGASMNTGGGGPINAGWETGMKAGGGGPLT